MTSVLPAANYDPTVFDSPREINCKRPRKTMLAFAGGVHSCMGAHLARLEMRICISEFLRRIPNFQLKEGFKVEYYAGGVVGPRKLPLTRKKTFCCIWMVSQAQLQEHHVRVNRTDAHKADSFRKSRD